MTSWFERMKVAFIRVYSGMPAKIVDPTVGKPDRSRPVVGCSCGNGPCIAEAGFEMIGQHVCKRREAQRHAPEQFI